MSSNLRKKDGRKFPELPPKYSSSRELRNKAEKIRRDRLNGLIEEMKSLVPIICNKNHKSEKKRSNILRLTANYLKISQIFSTATHDQSMICSQDGLPHLEAMGGLFFLLSSEGKILFISENSIKHVGYSQVDLLGMSIFDFIHPTDQQKIRSFITRRETIGDGTGSESWTSEEGQGKGPRRSFYIRFRERSGGKADKVQYEHMNVVGHVKTGVGEDVFVGLMRPVKDRPITELSLTEAIQDQYISRHLPDGRIIYSDHRISTIAGYLPSEVNGKSAFNFFYAEDLPWTTMALRHMFASANGEGTTVYRLFTNTGELICLQTKGFLEFNKATKKIESFLCINTLIREEDQDKYLNEQKEKFTPYISELQNASNMKSLALEDLSQPKKLKSSNISVISKISPSETSSECTDRNTLININRPSDVRDQYERGNSACLSRKRKIDDQSSVASNLQYTPARDLPMHRFEEGVRIVDVDQNISLPDTSGDIPPVKKRNLDFQDLIDHLNSSIGGPASNEDNSQGTKTSTQSRYRSVIQRLPKSNISEAGINEIELINKELQKSIQNGTKNQTITSLSCNAETSSETNQNSHNDCNVSDLMDILNNDLFNPSNSGQKF